MAERRMLAKTIIESDMFSDMPAETQMLYVRLNLAADDDGFVSNPRQVMRMCGATEDSMKMLIKKKFVLSFDIGDNFVFLIKHWKIHNYLRSDRYKASAFKNILRDVYYDENKSYSLTPGEGKTPVLPPTDTNGIPTVDQPDTNGIPGGIPRLGKDSIGKGSVGEESIDEGRENNTLNNSFIQVGEIGDCKGEEQSSIPTDRPERSEAEINTRRSELHKLMAWYEKNNLDPVNVRQMAAAEGITL